MRRLALTPHVAAKDTDLRPGAGESIRPPPPKPRTSFFYCNTAIELGVFPTL